MVWGEGRFLSKLPREAPEVGGLDNIDPESSIICWLSTMADLQINLGLTTPSHHGEENKGSWEVPSQRQKDKEMTDSPWALEQRWGLPLGRRWSWLVSGGEWEDLGNAGATGWHSSSLI